MEPFKSVTCALQGACHHESPVNIKLQQNQTQSKISSNIIQWHLAKNLNVAATIMHQSPYLTLPVAGTKNLQASLVLRLRCASSPRDCQHGDPGSAGQANPKQQGRSEEFISKSTTFLFPKFIGLNPQDVWVVHINQRVQPTQFTTGSSPLDRSFDSFSILFT